MLYKTFKMHSIAVFVLLVSFHYFAGNAQPTRNLHRRLDHLERRYELDSSRTSESFREVWEHLTQHDAKVCPAIQANIKPSDVHQKNKLGTGSMEIKTVQKLEEEIEIMKRAFSDEKKIVRTLMHSMQKVLNEYNESCAAEIKKLKADSDCNKSGLCTCSSKWIKIYENGPNGEAIYGERSDLIHAVMSGSSVKLLADKHYMTNVQNLKPASGHLMAQALFHVSMLNSREFQDNAYWWFVIASTTGHWYMARYNVGEHTPRGDDELRYGIEWFIRRPCEIKPSVRILPGGTIAAGSINNVRSAVRNGYPIRVTSLKTGLTFPADNLEVNGEHVAAQSVWHLSQELLGNRRLIFQKNAYWYFTIWSTKGKQEMSRWTVGEHEPRGRTSNTTSTDWFVDPCWRLAFRHGPHGESIEGDKQHLINAIHAGHRVRIVYREFSFEANVLFISDENVHALSMDSVSKKSFDRFEDHVSWMWRSASTDGKLQLMKTPVGSSSNTVTNERVQIAWYVDKRVWKETATIAFGGEASNGSKADLFKYVKQGADVRIGVRYSEDSDFFYMQPDNIQLFPTENNLTAMHLRQAKFFPDIVPAWVFTCTTTDGLIDKSTWTLGKHEEISHKLENVHTVWFISE